MKDELLFLYLNRDLDKEESTKVKKWINNNPEHFENIKLIWETSENKYGERKPDLTSAWNKINPEKGKIRYLASNRKIPTYKKIFSYAAVILLFISIGLLGYHTFSEKNGSEWLEYVSTSDSLLNVKLPDGSQVSLNANSKIRFEKTNFLKNRELFLEGEAFFEVRKNPSIPFLVHSKNVTTEVLGTSFNVNANDTIEKVVITVKSGKVAFYSDENLKGEKLLLVAGDVGEFSSTKNKLRKYKNDNHNFLAWKTNVLIFNNITMHEASEILSRHFNKKIILKPPLNHQKITARFLNKSIEQILNSLDLTLDIKHAYTKEGVVLSIR